jgi:hypothetical protein
MAVVSNAAGRVRHTKWCQGGARSCPKGATPVTLWVPSSQRACRMRALDTSTVANAATEFLLPARSARGKESARTAAGSHELFRLPLVGDRESKSSEGCQQ